MDTYDPRRKRTNRARERYQSRRGRDDAAPADGAMATPREAESQPRQSARAEQEAQRRQLPEPLKAVLAQIVTWLRDGWWYATHRPHVAKWLTLLGVVIFIFFAASRLLGGRIFPSVYALGVSLDGLTVEEATVALVNAWNDDVRIELRVDGEVMEYIAPVELGMNIDAVTAAQNAKSIGMAGMPLGYNVNVPIQFVQSVAEDYLLAQSGQINRLPYNAGYALQNGVVVGVAGRAGRDLDIATTLDTIAQMTDEIILTRRLDVLTLPLQPDFMDPESLLESASVFASTPFRLTGYDPFTDESMTWATQPEVVVNWLEAGPGHLNVRESAFRDFIDQLNDLITENDSERFISYEEALERVQAGIEGESTSVYVRLRHVDQVYTIKKGDFGYRLARRFGVPFFLIQEANPGRNFDELYEGDQVNIPSADVVLPEPPIPHKRIIVDLDRQHLVAFENGQEVFNWPISSGGESYPTYPGIYQILTHSEEAVGSSFSLCSDEGGDCGQWTMYWFMGIYEIAPELMNGFHGAVLLPNGGYLNGGSVGNPATFGCVMSVNDQAKILYDWAEVGTMVEIISSEYAPRSALAQQVKARDLSAYQPVSDQLVSSQLVSDLLISQSMFNLPSFAQSGS